MSKSPKHTPVSRGRAVSAATHTRLTDWFEQSCVSPEEAEGDGATQVVTWGSFERLVEKRGNLYEAAPELARGAGRGAQSRHVG